MNFTFNIGELVAILGGVGGTLVALTGWVMRTLVLDRIKAVEARVEKQGGRFGEDVKNIEKWQAAHDAVEAERYRPRSFTSPHGITVRDE